MSELFNILPRPQRKPLRILAGIPFFLFNPSSDPSSPCDREGICPSVTTPSTSIRQPLCHVICMYDFDSSDPVHLPFHKDEVLKIVKQEHSGWWAAMRPQGDRVGWIPSSFVLPLDRRKIIEYPDETLVPPLSAIYNPWVPVSDEAFAFQLVTPIDPIPYQDHFDDTRRCHNDESPLNPSNRYHKLSSEMGRTGFSLTPESLSPQRMQGPHFPQNLLPSESGTSELTRTWVVTQFK